MRSTPTRPDDGRGVAIVWFRDDLRVADNPALAAAVARAGAVVPVFVLDEVSEGVRRLGGAARWWLHHSLAALARDLEARGARLVLRRGGAADILARLVAETGADAVFWNRRYGAPAQLIDAPLKRRLCDSGVAVESFDAALLFEPWTVRTGAGEPYRVFSPFWRAARAGPEPRAPLPAPERIPGLDAVAGERLGDWELLPRRPDWSGGLATAWTPGEQAARADLSAILERGLRFYAADRDRPGLSVTSRLSPRLRFGEVSPHQLWRAVRHGMDAGRIAPEDGDKFLSEVGWREFSYSLMHHNPELARRNLDSRFDGFPWRHDEAALRAWRRGLTGYPIVDAGMRELWQTGWMHNRVRMVAASFLIKDLMIDWRAGEAWFWDTLVDADAANNAASWQWVAGCGADAAPYFRVFNPVLQGERFDPRGAYVRRWLPELAGLPDRHVHQPWTAPREVLSRAGVRLGVDYPHPIVDHARARDRALAAFAALKEAAA